jgi:hypothetical protein
MLLSHGIDLVAEYQVLLYQVQLRELVQVLVYTECTVRQKPENYSRTVEYGVAKVCRGATTTGTHRFTARM